MFHLLATWSQARSCPGWVEVLGNSSPKRMRASAGRRFSYAEAVAGGLNHTRLPTFGDGGERGKDMVVQVSLRRETIMGLVAGRRMVLYFHMGSEKEVGIEVGPRGSYNGLRQTYAASMGRESSEPSESFEFPILVEVVGEMAFSSPTIHAPAVVCVASSASTSKQGMVEGRLVSLFVASSISGFVPKAPECSASIECR